MNKVINFNKAEYLVSYGLARQIPTPKETDIQIAFSGRSNVGKSSSINKIFNRKSLARVSSVPGKTATINFYGCSTDEDVHFVDLPGYGYAKASKKEIERWSKLIDGYFEKATNLELVIALIDMRHKPSKLDVQMIEFLIEAEINFIVVMTKSDKLNKSQYNERMENIRKELPYGDQLTIIPFSSMTGAGVEEVHNIINELVVEIRASFDEINNNEDNLDEISEIDVSSTKREEEFNEL